MKVVKNTVDCAEIATHQRLVAKVHHVIINHEDPIERKIGDINTRKRRREMRLNKPIGPATRVKFLHAFTG